MKKSHKKKEIMISESFEKSLQDWKLPPSSASDVYERSGSYNCFFPNCSVGTVEKEIPLSSSKGFSTFFLFSKNRQRVNLMLRYEYLHVGMIEVGLKPTRLGSNTSAKVFLRDNRFTEFRDSVRCMVESSLCDGPIYFSYFPTHSVALCDASETFCINVKIKGSSSSSVMRTRRHENITLMYRFHYKVTKHVSMYGLPSCHRADERGETTFFVTNIAQSNRVVSKKMCWDQIGEDDDENDDVPSSPPMVSVGNANIDWKETAEAHVLKVDVPGFKKEEVKVEIENGRIVQISGERREEDDDDESDDKWHCVERSSGRFLRRVTLPEDAKLDELKAAMENGVLTVTVPKEEADKSPQVKKVVIN